MRVNKRCKNPIIYKAEVCTPKSGWEESNTIERYFIGLESNSEPIPQKVAMHFVDSWRGRWPQWLGFNGLERQYSLVTLPFLFLQFEYISFILKSTLHPTNKKAY